MQQKSLRQRKLEATTERKLPILKITGIVFLWLILTFVLFFISPSMFLAVPLFLFLFLLSMFFTFLLILNNKKRALIMASTTTIFLILRYFGIGNFINFFLLIGIAITIWIYDAKADKVKNNNKVNKNSQPHTQKPNRENNGSGNYQS